MAVLNLRANRAADAAACYRQLASQYSRIPLRGGLTPAAWLAALPSGDALRKELNRPLDDWPKGAVNVTRGEVPAAGPITTIEHGASMWRSTVPTNPTSPITPSVARTIRRLLFATVGAGRYSRTRSASWKMAAASTGIRLPRGLEAADICCWSM